MSYNYLLELYKDLDRRMQQIQAKSTKHDIMAPYAQGQLDTLQEFKQFMHDKYNHKLPRRLQ